MENQAIMAISPLDGRYKDKMGGLGEIFSEYGLIKYRCVVEIRWLIHLSKHLKDAPALSQDAENSLISIINHFSEKDALAIKAIEAETNHDVKAVEYFIKGKMAEDTELTPLIELIHFGCTSEDINNLAYSLMSEAAKTNEILPQIISVKELIDKLALKYADLAMLCRTHGQAATPSTLGKELANFSARLQRQIKQLQQHRLLGKLNGATGNFNAMQASHPEVEWPTVCSQFVEGLNLEWNAYTTQIEPHDSLAELFQIIERINTILIDFTRDIWSYISLHYFTQKTVANEVGSSTMPHKVNPIDFENAEGNLGLANALLGHMAGKLCISRWQRDLSDSTVLRNIGVALGHSKLAYLSCQKGINKLEANQGIIEQDLANHWEVLAEAVQTVMRRHNLKEPYERLKAFTRGKQINQGMLKEFINELELAETDKQKLLQMEPKDYIGYAAQLAKGINNH